MARHPLVLIVDYDPKNLRALSDLFRSHGYTVESASDGVVAVASFKKNKPDLLLLEAMIPKKHGFEVCQEIKKLPEGKSTPIIIMTGVYKGRKYRSQAMHVHGCDGTHRKPFAPRPSSSW
jgi:CheY-like chemotaxis protein